MLTAFSPHDGDQVAGVRDAGNGIENGGIDPTEDGAVRRNPQRQRECRDCREAWILRQHAEAMPEVLDQAVPPEPAARFVEALLGLRNIPESAPRRPTGFLVAQALLLQSFGFEFEMRSDFCCKVTLFAFSPEHRLNPPGPRTPEPARWPPPAVATWLSL